MQLDITELLKGVSGGGDGVLPDPDLLTYYKNLEDRVFWIDYEIDDSLTEIIKQIILINKEDKKNNISVEDRKPIKLCVFSVGGNLDSCFALIDTCLASQTPVWTYNMGCALSAGLMLVLAGSRRFSLKHAQFLLHSGSGGTEGSYEQVVAQQQQYNKLVNMMQDFILERTKIDKKLFNKNKSKEWYVFYDEALTFGLIDEIIERIDDVF